MSATHCLTKQERFQGFRIVKYNTKHEEHKLKSEVNVLQAAKVGTHIGIVTLNVLREMNLTHCILVLFIGLSWTARKLAYN